MGSSLLFTGAEWSYDALARAYETIEPIALGELGLEIYPNQIEIITAEQMLDAYASIGLPLMYNHWSFGKQFAYNELLYRKGARGLAYEIVINAVPCVSYIMEDNSMAMRRWSWRTLSATTTSSVTITSSGSGPTQRPFSTIWNSPRATLLAARNYGSRAVERLPMPPTR